MPDSSVYTSVRLLKQTAEALKTVGRKGDTYDKIVWLLIKEHNKKVEVHE